MAKRGGGCPDHDRSRNRPFASPAGSSFPKRVVRAMKRALLAALVVLGASSPAAAMTGNELREYCSTRSDFCQGFIMGAAGMFRFQMVMVNPICFGGATSGQIHDVVVDYLEGHPELRDEHALILVTWAIREAFDCPEAERQSMGHGKKTGDGYARADSASPSGP
jgi:Rap1a immunity proteins